MTVSTQTRKPVVRFPVSPQNVLFCILSCGLVLACGTSEPAYTPTSGLDTTTRVTPVPAELGSKIVTRVLKPTPQVFAYNGEMDAPPAIRDYDAAIGIDPDFALAYYNRGFTYYEFR